MTSISRSPYPHADSLLPAVSSSSVYHTRKKEKSISGKEREEEEDGEPHTTSTVHTGLNPRGAAYQLLHVYKVQAVQEPPPPPLLSARPSLLRLGGVVPSPSRSSSSVSLPPSLSAAAGPFSFSPSSSVVPREGKGEDGMEEMGKHRSGLAGGGGGGGGIVSRESVPPFPSPVPLVSEGPALLPRPRGLGIPVEVMEEEAESNGMGREGGAAGVGSTMMNRRRPSMQGSHTSLHSGGLGGVVAGGGGGWETGVGGSGSGGGRTAMEERTSSSSPPPPPPPPPTTSAPATPLVRHLLRANRQRQEEDAHFWRRRRLSCLMTGNEEQEGFLMVAGEGRRGGVGGGGSLARRGREDEDVVVDAADEDTEEEEEEEEAIQGMEEAMKKEGAGEQDRRIIVAGEQGRSGVGEGFSRPLSVGPSSRRNSTSIRGQTWWSSAARAVQGTHLVASTTSGGEGMTLNTLLETNPNSTYASRKHSGSSRSEGNGSITSYRNSGDSGREAGRGVRAQGGLRRRRERKGYSSGILWPPAPFSSFSHPNTLWENGEEEEEAIRNLLEHHRGRRVSSHLPGGRGGGGGDTAAPGGRGTVGDPRRRRSLSVHAFSLVPSEEELSMGIGEGYLQASISHSNNTSIHGGPVGPTHRRTSTSWTPSDYRIAAAAAGAGSGGRGGSSSSRKDSGSGSSAGAMGPSFSLCPPAAMGASSSSGFPFVGEPRESPLCCPSSSAASPSSSIGMLSSAPYDPLHPSPTSFASKSTMGNPTPSTIRMGTGGRKLSLSSSGQPFTETVFPRLASPSSGPVFPPLPSPTRLVGSTAGGGGGVVGGSGGGSTALGPSPSSSPRISQLHEYLLVPPPPLSILPSHSPSPPLLPPPAPLHLSPRAPSTFSPPPAPPPSVMPSFFLAPRAGSLPQPLVSSTLQYQVSVVSSSSCSGPTSVSSSAGGEGGPMLAVHHYVPAARHWEDSDDEDDEGEEGEEDSDDDDEDREENAGGKRRKKSEVMLETNAYVRRVLEKLRRRKEAEARGPPTRTEVHEEEEVEVDPMGRGAERRRTRSGGDEAEEKRRGPEGREDGDGDGGRRGEKEGRGKASTATTTTTLHRPLPPPLFTPPPATTTAPPLPSSALRGEESSGGGGGSTDVLFPAGLSLTFSQWRQDRDGKRVDDRARKTSVAFFKEEIGPVVAATTTEATLPLVMGDPVPPPPPPSSSSSTSSSSSSTSWPPTQQEGKAHGSPAHSPLSDERGGRSAASHPVERERADRRRGVSGSGRRPPAPSRVNGVVMRTSSTSTTHPTKKTPDEVAPCWMDAETLTTGEGHGRKGGGTTSPGAGGRSSSSGGRSVVGRRASTSSPGEGEGGGGSHGTPSPLHPPRGGGSGAPSISAPSPPSHPHRHRSRRPRPRRRLMSQARGIGGKGVNAYLFSCPPREHTRASHTSTTSSSVGMMGLGGGGNGGVGDPTMGYSHRSARPSTSSSSSAVELEALPCTPFPCPVPAGGGGGGTGWSRRKRSTGAPSETKGRAALRTTSPVLLGVAKEEDEEEDEDEGIAGDDKEEEEEGGDDDEAAAGRREGSKSYTSSSGSKRKKRRTRNGWSESGGSSVVTVKSVGGGGGGPLSMPNHPLLTSHLGTPPYRESMCSSNSSRGARPLFFASHRPSTGPTATTPTPGVGWSSSSLGHQSMFWNERERKRFSRARHHHYPPVLVLGRRELIPSVPSGLRFGSTSSLPDAWMYATGGGGSGSGAGRRGWQESTSTTSSSGGNGNTSPGKGRVHRTYSLRSSSSCSSSMAVMAGGGTTEHWKEKSVETGVAAGEEEEVEGEGEGEEGGGGRHHTWNGGLVEDRTGSGSSSGGSWNCHRGKREEASPLLNAFSIASNAAAGGGMAARSGGSSGTGIGGGGHSKASPPHHRPNSSSDNGSTSATPIAINASGSSTGMIGFVGPCTPGLSSSTSPFSLTGFSASAGASVESYYSFSSSTKNPAPPPPPPLLPLPPRSPPAYYRVYGFHTGEDSTDVNSPASSPIEGSYRADTPHPFTPSSPALSTHPMASASSSPKFEATPTSPPFTRPITHFVPPSGSTTTTTSFRDAPYGRHHRVSDTRPTSSTSELGLFHERSEDQNDDAFGKKKEKPPLPWKPQQGEEHQVSTTVDRPVLHSPLLPLSPSLPFPSSAITSSASFRAGMTPPSSTTLPSRGVISTTALVPPPMRREGKTFPRLTKSTVTEDDEDATTSSSPPSSLPFPSSSEEEAPQTSATHAEGPCHDLHQVVENEKNLSFPTSQGPPHRHHHHTRTPTQIHAAHFLPTDGPDSSPSVPSLLLPSGTTIITTPGRAHRLPRMERPTRRGLAAPTGGGGEEAGGGEQDGGESQSESILSASSEGEALGIPPPPSPFPLPVLPRLPPFSIPSSSTALSWRPVDRAGYRAPWESTATTTTNTMMEGNGIEKVSTMTTTTGASKGPSLGWENLSNDPVGGGEAGGVEWHGIGGGGGGDVGPFTMSTTNEDVTARGGGGGLLATDLIFGHSFGSSLPLRQHTTVGVNVAVVPLEAHVQRVDANEEAAREPLQGEGPSKKNPSPPPPHHHPTRMTKSPFPSSPGSFGSSPSSFYNSSSSGSTPFSASHENKTAPDPSLPPPSSVAAVPFPYFHPILYALHPHEEGEGAGFVGSAGGVGRVVVLGGEDERGEMDEDTTSGGGGGEHLLGHASIYSCSIKSPVQGHTTAPGSVIWRDTVGKLEDEEEEEEVDEEGNTRATRRKFRPKEEGMGARPTILHEVEVPGEQEAQRTRMATAGAPAWTPFSSSFVGSIKGGGGWMPFHGSSGGGEASSGAGPASRAMSKLVSLTVPESPPTRVPQETKEKEEEKEEKEATPTQTREVEGNVSRTTYAGKPSHQGSGGDDKQQKGSHENDKKEEEKHTKESKKRKEEEEERYPSSASTRTEGRQVRGMTGTDVVVAAMSTTPSSSLTPTTTTTATYTKKMEEAAQRWKALMEKPSCGKTGRESTKR